MKNFYTDIQLDRIFKSDFIDSIISSGLLISYDFYEYFIDEELLKILKNGRSEKGNSGSGTKLTTDSGYYNNNRCRVFTSEGTIPKTLAKLTYLIVYNGQ